MKMTQRRVAIAFAAAALVAPLLTAGSATASSNGPTLNVSSGTHKAHMMPTFKKMGAPAHVVRSAGVYGYSYGSPPLVYNAPGPIQRTVRTYVLWWNPGHLQSGAATSYGGSTNYQSTTVAYLKDVNGSGLYANNTQYYSVPSGTTQKYVQNSTTYTASYTDTTAFPTGHCTNGLTGANCITDADIQGAVHRAQTAHGISGGGTEIFVLTPQGEGSCFTSGTCPAGNGAYTDYCAYHSYTNAVYGTPLYVEYANMPWSDPGYCSYPAGGQTFPNNAAHHEVDANINVLSHEQMETVTDPLISAWYDASGYEIGDECAWQFGTENWPSGGNVQFNGHPYDLQPEASVHASGCVLAGP